MSTVSTLEEATVRRLAEQAVGPERSAGWRDHTVGEPLAVLVEALAGEARLSADGVDRATQRLANLLASFIRIQADEREHPEILDVAVERPLVIVGLPRSGTTFLHALLSSDPRHRAPTWWESLYPSPPPDAATFEVDPRRATVQAEIDVLVERSPVILAALPMSADLSAECNTLMQPALRTVAFAAYFDVPSYQRWYLDTDQAPMYAYHRRALQQLAWRGPPGRWALKAPPHMFFMNNLVAEYPDATIVQIHRDPVKTIASTADLTAANRIVYSDDVDLAAAGRQTLDLWATGIDRLEAFRAARPDVEIIDVLYHELVADPIATVSRVYGHIGERLDDEAVAAMQRWMVDNAKEKRPVHHYSHDDFGLSVAEIDERFASYRAARSVPDEARR